MKTWEKVLAVAAGVGLAAVTVWLLMPKQPVAMVTTPVHDLRNQGVFDPNAAAIFGDTYSARSLWSSDAMGN